MTTQPSTLLTDLYQLAMLQGYFVAGMNETAAFEFFVRRLPPQRNFLVAAGLAQVLDYLESLRFSPDEIAWLAAQGSFRDDFLESLRGFRFSGQVEALPEGTIAFENEPLLRVVAPLPVAQLVESRLINLLHFQTLIASKAARAVLAAQGRGLVDFGFRRAHGAEAGLLSARASYLAGFAGTATVEAGRQFGLPLFGTMAHSFVQANQDEATAFRRFAHANSDNVVFLLDTYDVAAATQRVARLAGELRAHGITIRGVRLDSGDLAADAQMVREVLTREEFPELSILASGNLDERSIAELVSSRAPIDAFGVGTRLDVSADVPYLDCAYKLVEYAGQPRRKKSSGKASWPGRKQVFRRLDAAGHYAGDVIALADERASGTPLLVPVMRDGRRISPSPPLEQIRRDVAENLRHLPEALRSLDGAPRFPVEISPGLERLAAECDAQSAAANR